AQLAHEAMRAGARARQVAGPLARLRERCAARLVAAYAAHADAVAAGDASAALEVVDEFERIGALRYATEAAADAARLFLEAGRMDSARRAAARSRKLFISGQGAEPP